MKTSYYPQIDSNIFTDIDHKTILEMVKIVQEPSFSSNLNNLMAQFEEIQDDLLAMSGNIAQLLNQSNIRTVISLVNEPDFMKNLSDSIVQLKAVCQAQSNEPTSINKSGHEESDDSEYIELPKPVGDLLTSFDESIEVERSGPDAIVRMKRFFAKKALRFIYAFIMDVAPLLQAYYYHDIDAISNAQQHMEIMQEERKQTEEERKQTEEERKQTAIQQKIYEAITVDNVSDLSSENSD